MSESGKRGWATYAFCVLRGPEAPLLDRAPRALPGFRRLRSIAVDGSMWLIVADAPRDRYDEALIEAGLRDLEWVSRCAVAHERIIEHFMEQGAVVPLKFFGLFDDDARARSYFEGISEELDAMLERVEGCQEWGLRVSLEPARRGAARRASAPPEAPADGAAYLRRKQADRAETRQRQRRAGGAAETLYARLTARAVAARRGGVLEAEPGSRILLAAAFLVPAREAQSFEQEVQVITEELGNADVAVQLSGPWPPYHFVEQTR